MLQHTATPCNTLQHSSPHRNTLQHAATHYNTLQHTTLDYNTLRRTATHCNTLQHTATHCNTLQHTATNYTRPQHTSPHRNTLQPVCLCRNGADRCDAGVRGQVSRERDAQRACPLPLRNIRLFSFQIRRSLFRNMVLFSATQVSFQIHRSLTRNIKSLLRVSFPATQFSFQEYGSLFNYIIIFQDFRSLLGPSVSAAKHRSLSRNIGLF